MFKTKKELDAQFRPQLAKLRTEAERHLRGYTVAKVYYKNNIFETAEQYLLSYLSVKEDNDQAHKLLGQCYQRLKKPDKALQAFQRSLQLNSKQPEVLTEVCQLLLDDNSLNVNKARYWCELAESEKVQHDAVFSLRLELMNKENLEGGGQNQVEALIQKEICARPDDVQLRVRLLRIYLEKNLLLDAFRYVQQLESSQRDAFASSGEWYNTVWLVLSKYEQAPNMLKDWKFWLLIATCLERQVFISFGTGTANGGDCGTPSSVTETANLLFNLDQYLFKIAQLPHSKLNAQPELVTLFLAHFRGQLLLHATALLFRRELQQNKNKWRDTVRSALPLLLLAFQTAAPEAKQQWMQHCDEHGKQLINLWQREGSFRCAQVGRTLLSCIVDENDELNKENGALQLNRMLAGGHQQALWRTGDELLSQLRQTCGDKHWRRAVFALLFCNSDQRIKEQSSLLVRCAELAEPCFELPSYADIERHEEAAQYLRPQSLQHMVYLCLGNDNLAYVRAKCFASLKVSAPNLAFCGPESLCQLDVDAFLYAAALQAQCALAVEREAFEAYNGGSRGAEGRPRILPFANLRGGLCSDEQANWWLAAYQFYKNLPSDNFAEARATLQFGIEAVRGINGPKMDIMIVFRLGEIFNARAQDAVKAAERIILEARTESVFRHGLSLMKLHSRGALEPFRRYFKYARRNSSAVERQLTHIAEGAARWLAARLLKKGEYEELIEELTGVQLPFASFLQAEAYRKLDESKRTPKQVKRQYLERASECLNQTVMLLRGPNIDPEHTLNAVVPTELRRVQQAVARYSTDQFSPSGISANQQHHHNNSSTYEDAEEEFFSPALGSTVLGGGGGGGGGVSMHRSRREPQSASLLVPRITELEEKMKEMSLTLNFIKDKLVDVLEPLRQDISAVKDKVDMIEDTQKKQGAASAASNAHQSPNPPSRDDASQLLDEMYLFEDTLQQHQQQLYSQAPQQLHNSPFGGAHYNQAPQARIQTPNAAHQIHQNAVAAAAAAAYGSPLFTPNYPMNYYNPSPYMLAQQSGVPNAAAAAAAAAANGAMLAYNTIPSNSLLPQPNAENRALYGMLTQQQQQQQQQMHQQQQQSGPHPGSPATSLTQQQSSPHVGSSATSLTQQQSVPHVGPSATSLTQQQSVPHIGSPATSLPQHHAAVAAVTATTVAATAVNVHTGGVAQFNKSLNNQPVEKGPPANVVITSSDPLPNPKAASAQTQQPTLSVTIPSHHIKTSLLVQTPEALVPQSASNTVFGGAFSGFGGLNLSATSTAASPFASFGSTTTITTTPAKAPLNFAGPAPIVAKNSNTSITSSGPSMASSSLVPPVNAISNLSTFSFKPQVLQAAATAAAQQQNAGDATDDESQLLHKTNDSNVSGADLEPEYDPRPDFQPIIPLPDEIEVRTGEEDEDVMFCHRAKLFRLVSKEWKERGIGDMKILKNSSTGKSRILMRRDLTHKICANHAICKSLALDVPANEKKGCIWAADDFADEKMQREKFLVRFKLAETATLFQQVFRQAQMEDGEHSGGSNTMPPPATFTLTSSAVSSASLIAPPPFGLAKSAVGSFATSTPTAKTNGGGGGAASLLIKPQQSKQPQQSATSNTKTLFESLTSVSSITPTSTPQAETKPSSVSPFANFTFDKSALGSNTPSSAPLFSNIFSNIPFGSGTNATPFGALANTAQATNQATNAATGRGGQNEKSLEVASEGEADIEYVPTAQFNPVIPLPELIEVTTGEENETVLFEHRAKLLRFDKEAGEWKERGVGNMKVLQDKADPNRVRLVMRREQIHKLCCNQRLEKDTVFNYAKNSRTALSWAGQDFSENELVTQLLTVRFKTHDTCEKFHAAVCAAQEAMEDSCTVEGNAKGQEVPVSQKQQATVTVAAPNEVKGFGDAFKPKAGSWSCTMCCVSNGAETLYCLACETPKDDLVPKKEMASSAVAVDGGATFSFGFAAAGKAGAATPTAASNTKTAFTFGMTPPVSTTATTTALAKSTSTIATAPAAAATTSTGGFGDLFKPKVGSWNCEACYLSNPADTLHCKACDAPKDNTVPKKEATTGNVFSLAGSGASNFSFGFPDAIQAAPSTMTSATGFSFGAKPAATPTPNPVKAIFDKLADASVGDASKSFVFTPPSATSTALDVTKPTFSFTLPPKSMDAAGADTGENATTSSSSSRTFSLDKKEFSFTLKPKSPGRSAKLSGGGGDADQGGVEDGGGDDDSPHHEEEENNTYFTPVIPLPDKIEVRTGEEDEEQLYVHRAKLYRFADAEWKERGLGDVKILRHKETGTLRVVMRRDQVHKICLNHALNEEVSYERKDDKSWSFVVNDFTEGAVELLQCSLRFKTKEIAEAFKGVIDAALAGTASVVEPGEKNCNGSNNNNDNTSIASLAAEAEAISPCAGCRGCDPDTFEFPTYPESKAYSNGISDVFPALPLEMPALTLPTKPTKIVTPRDSSRFALKQSALLADTASPAVTTSPAATTSPEATASPSETVPTNIFASITGGPVVASPGKPSAASTFSFTAALNNINKADGDGGFLFGNTSSTIATGTPFSGGSLFGGTGEGIAKPLFGGSIFGGMNSATTTTKPTDDDSSKGIFGSVDGAGVAASAPGSGGSIFGGKPSIFSGIGVTKSEGTIFGGTTNTTPAGETIFGGSTTFGGFGGKLASSTVKTSSIFGGSSAGDSSLSGDAADKKENEKEQTSATFADLSKKQGGLDFAALAAGANTATSAIKAEPAGGFFGLTNQNAFPSFRNSLVTPNAKESANGTGTGTGDDPNDASATDDNYDPHYEPIIALPNEIVVSTGEENETKLFGERATLYRWDPDTKEWKERGVGELKLLEHRTLHTYRLVMRREQIHKLVLNHAIADDFSFENMNNNPKSFVWATLNYAESSEGDVEKLAVRFKKVELAEQFSKEIRKCIAAAQERATETDA